MATTLARPCVLPRLRLGPLPLVRRTSASYVGAMSDDENAASPERVLAPAAQRALAEAEARRRTQREAETRAEQGGPPGPEPTRYGDWEHKGLAVDF